MNWFQLKKEWQEALVQVFDADEANYVLLILAEELLPHYNKLAFRAPEFELEKDDVALLEKGVARLLNHEPLQYVLGKAWFYDLTLKVNPNVLIPRPETEELVEWILSQDIPAETSILDIGTGSGCIPLSLKKHASQATISAVDVDPKVLALAQENAQDLNLNVNFECINILDEKQWNQLGKFNIIVSNPPYIPHDEKSKMKENVLAHEPHLALFVEDENALIFYEKIADFAQLHLGNKGLLFFECNEFKALACQEMLIAKGFTNVEIRKDLQAKDRMIKCTLTSLKTLL